MALCIGGVGLLPATAYPQANLGMKNVTVEIVAYGPGLDMLKAESKVADRLNGAMDRKGGVKIVPGGVIHIMQRQRQGWSYVRP